MAWVNWVNLLHRHAFGRYGELLREASVDSHMGTYLDNDQNRPKSAECQHCAPNENYARELMQLFTVGVLKLNADGTPQRDSRGRYIETYTRRPAPGSAAGTPARGRRATGATGASRGSRVPGRRSATRAARW